MKKKSILKVLLLTLLACCLAFALVACGGTTYTVTYDYNDGGATQSTTIEVDEGSLLEEPTAPTRDGYTFDGWFNGDAEWTFATDTVTGDITLTAHWTQNVTPPPAHTHTYGDYTVTTAPTADAAGVATATCSGCEEGTEGHTTTMTLPALTEENIAAEAADGKYTVATTPATCTAAGSSVYTYHYDGDKTLVAATVTIPMAAHTYGTEIAEVPATCETAGTAAHYECSVCHKLFTKAGDTYTEVTAEDLAIAAPGHTYGDLIAEDPATCTEDGMEAHYFCDVCDTYFDSEKNPTTEADLAIAAPGHTYGDLIAEDPATCTETGMKAHYFCGVCDTYFDSEKNPTTEAALVIEAPGHTYGDLIAEDPATCTAAGTAAHYECSVCHKLFTKAGDTYTEVTAEDLVIAAPGHTYGDLIAEDPATCTTAGTAAHYECSVCHKLFTKAGDTYTEVTAEDLVIAAPGHTYGDLIAEDPATCTETGMKAHYFCGVCDTYFDSEKNPTTADALTIPMVAHSYKADVVLKDGTYTITGSCSTCETINETATLILEKGEEGATGTAPETLDVTFDGTSFMVTLPECTFERSGYAFTGWVTIRNGVNVVLEAGEEFSIAVDAEVTLTAQWALVTEVRSEEELREALSTDTEVITIAESFEISAPITISRAVTIDLNNEKLTFTGDGTQLTIQGTESEGIKVTLRNGSIEFTTTAYVTSTCIAINLANVTIDDVNITTGTTAIFPAVATLTVKNSTITAFTYGIGTNASVKVEQDGTTKEVFGPVNLTIENSIVKTTDKDSTAVLFNVEGSLKVTDSALEGGRQGLILRKGIGTVTGGSIASRWEYTDVDQYIPAEGAQAAWRTGNEVPMAAIVIGDTGKNYDGDAILTISGTEVKLGNADATRYIYLWADTTDRTAAKLVYACDDAYMPDLAAKGQIVCGNDVAEVTVTHAALTHYDAKEATCTAAGMKEHYFCDVCNTYFDSAKEPTTAEALVISALGHTYGDLIAEDPATCTETGMKAHYFCDVCNTYFDSAKEPTTAEALVISALGHTYGDLIAEDPATCTEAGMKEHYFCDVCNTYFDSAKEATTAEALVISALGHTYGEWVIKTEPSASGKGVATITCSVCAEGTEGHTQSMTLPERTEENVAEEATAGKYTVVETKATCEAAGSTVYTYHFMFDGELMPLELPAIEHEQLEHVWNVTYEDTTLTASCPNGCGGSYTATLTLTGTGATVALGEAATFTVADGFAIDLSKLSVTKEEADVIRAYIANGSIVTGTQTVAANGTLALEVVVEDTSFTVGTDGSQDSGAWSAGAWYVPVWTSVIQKGEVVKVEGALKSKATENHYGAKPLLYSTDNVLGAFRPDNWVTGYDDVNNQYGTAEGFVISKQSIVLYDGATGDDNTNDFFQAVLTDCYYVVMYDWSSDESIKITINLVGNANGAKQIETSEYTIIAAENASLKDWYRIGLSYECCYYNVSSVLRCNGVHDELYCDICNGLNTEQIEALATTSQDFVNNDPDSNWWGGGQTSAVTLSGDYVFKLTFKAPEGRITPDSVFEFATNLGSSNENFIDLNLNGITATDFWGNGTDGWANIATKEIVQEGTRPANGGWAGDYTVYAVRLNNQLIVRAEFTATGSETLTYAITWTMDVAGSMAEGDTTFQIVGNPYGLTDFTMMTGTIPAQS